MKCDNVTEYSRNNIGDMKNKKMNIITIMLLVVTISLAAPIYSKNAIYHNKQGWEYLEKGEVYSAIISFQSALQKNPRYREALTGLAHSYVETGGYEEAISLYERVLQLYENDEDALLGMARAMTGIGRFNEAINIYEKLNSLSFDNNRSRYGMAYLYFRMGKTLWAKRMLDRVLTANPFHYDSLLLMGEIKQREGRYGEAEKYITKAIESRGDYPGGYVAYGNLLFDRFTGTGESDFIAQAVDEFKKALSISPSNLEANRFLGYISYYTGDLDAAISYYQKVVELYPEMSIPHYNLALAREKNGSNDQALNEYTKAVEQQSLNSLVYEKRSQFLVLNNYKTGHPLRVSLAKNEYEHAQDFSKKNLPEHSLLLLRKSLFLNPMDPQPRMDLADSYLVRDYYRFYVDQLKKLHSMNPSTRSRDRLNVAIIKRRDHLYHRAGYSQDLPQRDVPRVLLLDLVSMKGIPPYPDGGTVLSNAVNYAFSQYGRYRNVPTRTRMQVNDRAKGGNQPIDDIIRDIHQLKKRGEIPSFDFLLYGNYEVSGNFIRTSISVMNLKTGVVIGNLQAEDQGKYAVSGISLRLARQLYEMIPFRGRIIDYVDDSVLVNLGNYDGISSGDLLVSYVPASDPTRPERTTEKIIFRVTETDTLLSLASPVRKEDLERVSKKETVYPVKKRRAKLLD